MTSAPKETRQRSSLLPHHSPAEDLELSFQHNLDCFGICDVFLLENSCCQRVFVVGIEHGDTFLHDDGAVIELGTWPVLPIFEHLQALGNVAEEEMLRTFNMGLGMLIVVPAKKFKKAQTLLERAGEKFYSVGRIVKGDRKVVFS